MSTPVSALLTGQPTFAASAAASNCARVDPLDVAGHRERDPGQPEAAGRIRPEADVGRDSRASSACRPAWATSLDSDIA